MAAFCFIPIEVGWALCYIPVALGVNMLLPWGAVAEWLRRGLQILVPRFKSGPRLQLFSSSLNQPVFVADCPWDIILHGGLQ